MRGPRERQVLAIDAERDRQLDAGIDVGGVIYHTDNTFLLELLALVMGYQIGILSGTQAIRTMDNSIRQLAETDIITLAAAVGERRKAIYAASWSAKDALP